MQSLRETGDAGAFSSFLDEEGEDSGGALWGWGA